MKVHSQDFKNKLKQIRETDAIITYNDGNEEVEINADNILRLKYSVNGDILRSIMKQLEIKLDRKIPKNTVLNLQFGLKTNGEYEYINYGNFVVYEAKKEEETGYFNMLCYDKMLYSMKKYDGADINYPISIRNYINTICNKLGLTFKNANDVFANYNKEIPRELYLGATGTSLGYTFRDVLDELAQVTASAICINNNDELEIRYFNETNDTINEDYLKNINVTFEEKYGPINSIVLSRSADTDNIYLRDEDSVIANGLCEIKISNNQILNFNDRDTYLPDILNKLNGIEYYINDFDSNGIIYYDFYDIYNVSIGETTYKCLLLNDEITIESGLTETIYTQKPDTSVTDYSKADKTDRSINQTYLIVDKQNQTIESVVTQTIDTTNPNSIASKTSRLTQRVDSLESEISNITGMVTTKESTSGTFTFTDTTPQSEPLTIKVHPIETNISYLYPNSSLYPSSSLFMKVRKIRFHNNDTNEDFDYQIPNDLLYYDDEHYDEFYLDYGDGTPESQTCQITKRCKYNADGTVSLLSEEQIVPYTYNHLVLSEGIYTVSLLGYNQAYILTTLMAKNIYTDQFYTKVQTDSKISQTAENITLGVSQALSNYSTTAQMNSAISLSANEINSVVATKVGNDEIISRINQSAEAITIDASKINLQGYVTVTDLSTAGSTTINGANITTGSIDASRISGGTLNIETAGGGYLSAGANTTHVNVSGLNVTGNGGIRMYNHNIGGCYEFGTQYITASGSDGVVKCNTIFRAENLKYKDDDGVYRDVVGLYRWFLTGKNTNTIAIRDIYGNAHYLKFEDGVLSSYQVS